MHNYRSSLQNSIVKLYFLYCIMNMKIAWINPWGALGSGGSCLFSHLFSILAWVARFLNIHLTLLASFPSSLIIYSYLTGQVPLLYSIMRLTHTEYDLVLLLMANKATKSLNSHHLLLILVITLSNALVPFVSPR